ncbi:MAG: hypothetical protein J6T26_00680 [Firmicutes bacterium]|nr:hypothetical protein [Bacillota bacterium]
MTTLRSRIFDSCNLLADYSQAGGDPAVPFLVTLNLTASRLTPGAGQNQRFCYDVTGIGLPGGDYADLAQLVLGLCEDVGADDIASLAVAVNGVPQQVEFGPEGNVRLFTAADPDPVSGLAGLAFYFPLHWEDSQLQLCFELTEPRPIGPMGLAVSGGGTTLDSLDICGPVCSQPEEPVTAYYSAEICAPVSVTPFALAGEPQVTPCGEPEISLGENCGRPRQDCGFTVRQRLCVAVPLQFGAEAVAGETRSRCIAAGGEEACGDCCDGGESGVINRPDPC